MNIPGGLYVITDADLLAATGLVDAVEQAIVGGARFVQYRDKRGDPQQRLRQAHALNALCRDHGIPLIVNDDVELAARVDAAGVHLGEDDPPLHTAQARLGKSAIIGVSCYNRLDLALAAARMGASYVAFGSFYPSSTKPKAVRADIALLREAREVLTLPIVAIGGITADNGRALIEAGADFLAVIKGVFGRPDIRTAAQAYAQLFMKHHH